MPAAIAWLRPCPCGRRRAAKQPANEDGTTADTFARNPEEDLLAVYAKQYSDRLLLQKAKREEEEKRQQEVKRAIEVGPQPPEHAPLPPALAIPTDKPADEKPGIDFIDSARFLFKQVTSVANEAIGNVIAGEPVEAAASAPAVAIDVESGAAPEADPAPEAATHTSEAVSSKAVPSPSPAADAKTSMVPPALTIPVDKPADEKPGVDFIDSARFLFKKIGTGLATAVAGPDVP